MGWGTFSEIGRWGSISCTWVVDNRGRGVEARGWTKNAHMTGEPELPLSPGPAESHGETEGPARVSQSLGPTEPRSRSSQVS
eukprot:746036-Hanusia_phi.AAC.1